MRKLTVSCGLSVLLALPTLSIADPIIEILEGGADPATLGGHTMTPFDDVPVPDPNCATSSASPLGGAVEFRDQGGNAHCMNVESPDWWQYEEHGNVYTTGTNWVELVLPEDTLAFYFFVGGNRNGSGWMDVTDANGAVAHLDFGHGTDIGFGNGVTPGFGVYSADGCTAIKSVVIDPFRWGTGNFGISRGSCQEVPEPAPLGLLGLGLFAILLSRRGQFKLLAANDR